jgi:transposase
VDTLALQELIARNARLESLNHQLAAENQWLKEQFGLARAGKFGASSEKTEVLTGQAELLFNEAEMVADSSETEPTKETIEYTRKKKSVGHREEMLADLPTETIEYRLPEEEQVCSGCGGAMHEMSTETREELEIIPVQVRVKRHVRYVYGCRHCERHEIEVPIKRAPAPAPIIAKSIASASAIAFVMASKFVEAMPLYRQEKHFERLGIELPRAVTSNWMLKGSDMLVPLYSHMRERLLNMPALHADETSLQVLKEPGRGAESKSYMWLYRSGRAGPPVVLYEYQATRGGEHPRRFLEGFGGHLHVDGYVGYEGMKGVTLVGCWAHVRRKFVDALKVLPKGKRTSPDSLANVALKYIDVLFEIERDMRDATDEERRVGRDQRSRPVVGEFKVWLDSISSTVLPKSLLGTAIGYAKNQWPKLVVFLSDGRLELDNNRSERSIRPFVMGRKNWLFANTPRGARASAVIYSIVETAKENGLDPYGYLQHVFERLPGVDPRNQSEVDDLMPWSRPIQAALDPQRPIPITGPVSP